MWAVAAAVLWLLSVLMEETFGWFSLGWAITIVAGVFGIMFVLRGLFSKSAGPLKKLYIYFGAALIAVAVFALIGELAVKKDNLVMPIIAVVVTAALLLGFLAVGGKKWDQGDNQNVGYKIIISVKRKRKRNPKRIKKTDSRLIKRFAYCNLIRNNLLLFESLICYKSSFFI